MSKALKAKPSSPFKLHQAVVDDDLKTVSDLLEQDPWLITDRDGHGRTPLHLAVANGNFECVMLVLNNETARMTDFSGRTAVQYAVLFNHGHILSYLLNHPEASKDARIGDTCHRTPLHLAVERGHNPNFLSLMCSPAALDVWSRNVWQEIPLRTAWRTLGGPCQGSSGHFITACLEFLCGYDKIYWPLSRTEEEVRCWYLLEGFFEAEPKASNKKPERFF